MSVTQNFDPHDPVQHALVAAMGYVACSSHLTAEGMMATLKEALAVAQSRASADPAPGPHGATADQQRTREPWECSRRDFRGIEHPHNFYIVGDRRPADPDDEDDDSRDTVISIATVHGVTTAGGIPKANAERIVACVNAMAGLTNDEVHSLVAERDRLTAENAALRAQCASSLANNLCPDHRDKQKGKPCLACEVERLTATLSQLQPIINENKALNQYLAAVYLSGNDTEKGPTP